MHILHSLLSELKDEFARSRKGEERRAWFIHTLVAIILPFTSSRTSNLLRTPATLFGYSDSIRKRYYTFMGFPKIPWDRLWPRLWSMIPQPETNGRLMLALDDYINPKAGRKIFGCARIFDHAAKQNQSRYPWAQNIVAIGLLKVIKGRWACLPLGRRFSFLKRDIEKNRPKYKGQPILACDRVVMAKTLKCPIRVVWVYRRSQWVALFTTDLTLRVAEIIEYYGARWKLEASFKELKRDIGSAETQSRHPVAVQNHLDFCLMATSLTWIYACRLEKTPSRRHLVKGRNHYAFSDVRRLVAKAALDDNFSILCPTPRKSSVNSLVTALMRMAA